MFINPQDLLIERLNRDIRIKLHLDIIYTIEEDEEWTNEIAAQKIVNYESDATEDSIVLSPLPAITYDIKDDNDGDNDDDYIVLSPIRICGEVDSVEINIELIDLQDDISPRSLLTEKVISIYEPNMGEMPIWLYDE